MKKLVVIAVDDERDILTSLEYDLEILTPVFRIELCETGKEAREVIEGCVKHGDHVALLITDQIMPGMTGVELMKSLDQVPEIAGTKVLMLTGQATHQDTIEAVNSSRLNGYLAKPWEKDELLGRVREVVSDYLIEQGMDVTPYLKFLNPVKLLQKGRLGNLEE